MKTKGNNRVQRKGRKVFVKCFRHYRTGKLVYPKNASCFCFTVAA